MRAFHHSAAVCEGAGDDADADLIAAYGRSDRTQLALLATRHPAGARLGRLFERGEVGVVGGLALGLRFPARALAPGHAHTRQLLRGELEVPVQEAVGAQAGEEELLVSGDASWSHLASRGNTAGTRSTRVTVTTLDAVLASGEAPPDVVKLDVEGSEGDVLRGAQRLLAEHRPAMVVELHGTTAEVCDILDAAGYAAERLDAAGAPRDAPAHAHVLARPR